MSNISLALIFIFCFETWLYSVFLTYFGELCWETYMCSLTSSQTSLVVITSSLCTPVALFLGNTATAGTVSCARHPTLRGSGVWLIPGTWQWCKAMAEYFVFSVFFFLNGYILKDWLELQHLRNFFEKTTFLVLFSFLICSSCLPKRDTSGWIRRQIWLVADTVYALSHSVSTPLTNSVVFYWVKTMNLGLSSIGMNPKKVLCPSLK